MDVEEWIETWRGPLVGLLAARGASWTDAAELAQDALAEAWLGRERLRGDPADPRVSGPWLRGIARNLLAAHERRRRVRREEPLAFEPPHQGAREPEDARLDALRRAMERLPRRLRVVVYMHYLERTSVREVAALLGATEKAVESRLYKARRRLRRLMDVPAGRGADEGSAR